MNKSRSFYLSKRFFLCSLILFISSINYVVLRATRECSLETTSATTPSAKDLYKKFAKERNLFENKVILAPMVRMNCLPFRLLALDYGADLVYSEEIIDFKLLKSERRYNEILNTIDYIDKSDGSLIFRTCNREKKSIIFQIGTSNPDRAAEAATIIEQDVAGIDINMGCPKHFSISGGMGAALLSNITNAQKIIESVRNKISIPVSCKIRVFEDVKETISFCKLMETSGVSCIAIHGRTPKERLRSPNRNSVIKEVASSISVPVIANGGSNDISNYEDIIKFRENTNASSVMIARAAQYNCSIFRETGKLPLDDVIKSFLNYAINYDNRFSNTKYCVQYMLSDLLQTPRGKLFLETQNLEQICKIWKLDDYYRFKMKEYRLKGLVVQGALTLESPKRNCEENRNGVFTLYSVFIKSYYLKDTDLPKNVLFKHSEISKYNPPKYEIENKNKLFQGTVIYNKKKYCSSHWERNKKSAEQAAAIVCLCYLQIYDIEELRNEGIIL